MKTRLVGFPLLLAATACATANTARPNLEPKNGPMAQVSVHYSGGLTQRRVSTSFRVRGPSHVLVGRLSGDGSVEVLFPETPKASSFVAGGKTYAARPFDGGYDAVPQLFNYATRMQRSYSARMSSYDGLGNGFVFIIATQYPMFTEALDDHGQWSDSLQADGYFSAYDPRIAIKDLAEVLTRGMPYTLDYANAFTTTSFTGFADAAWDCAALTHAFGYVGTWHQLRMMGLSFPYMGGLGAIAWYQGYRGASAFSGCGFGYDRRYSARRYSTGWWGTQWWQSGEGWVPRGGGPVTVGTGTPSTPTKHAFSTGSRRPGFRNGDESGAAFNLTRPRFDGQRNRSTATSSWAPPIKETQTMVYRNDHFARSNRPTGSHNSGFGGMGITRTGGVTSSTGITRSEGVTSHTPTSHTPTSHTPTVQRETQAQAPAPRATVSEVKVRDP